MSETKTRVNKAAARKAAQEKVARDARIAAEVNAELKKKGRLLEGPDDFDRFLSGGSQTIAVALRADRKKKSQES